jgi:transcription antitermination factor NusG
MEPVLEWFALRVKPRTEQVVVAALRGKGYELFLPTHRERKRWSDRVKTVETPLFAGYVFCRFDVQHRLPIVTTPAVLHVVGIGKTPHPIAPEEIDSLRVVTGSGLTLESWPYMHVGERVQIVAGPLSGATGILQSVKGHDRLVVSVSLLQRSVAVVVPESSVWPESA